MADEPANARERQLTRNPRGHILTNIGVWSPPGEWVVYDTRSDPAGNVFDGDTIERVHVRTGQVEVLYRSQRGAHCGVVTWSPVAEQVVFILGPEQPTPEWSYGPYHRQGVMVDAGRPGVARRLDARDLVPPFTPGALRGGSHVHVFSPDGNLVSFTYEDHVLAEFHESPPDHDVNLRNVGVSLLGRPVSVPARHPRNHDGEAFSVLVTRTTANPRPGSDEICRACEEGWVGVRGYRRPDGSWQRHALAFQGHVATEHRETVAEVFLVDLPEDLTVPGDLPLAGTATRLPFPPRGTVQRRLTHTDRRRYPGLQGPRHWLRSSPDGSRIAFLMKDDQGVVQLWTVAPAGGEPKQVTRNPWSIASAFSWSPDGRWIAHAMDGSVWVTEVATGSGIRLTVRAAGDEVPRPEACVFSPDGRRIAYVRRVSDGGQWHNQVWVAEW